MATDEQRMEDVVEYDPTTVLAHLQAHALAIDSTATEQPTRWIIDFDHTLVLANSTELFLASARPRWLAALVGLVVTTIIGWLSQRQLDARQWRADWLDPWRVLAVTVILPWTWLGWPAKARHLVKMHANHALLPGLRAAARQKKICVATLGTRAIVEPMAQAFGPWPVVAAPLWAGWRYRRAGKLAALRECFSDEELSTSLALTDSLADTDVLRAVRWPYLVKWPGDNKTSAYFGVYVPLRYTCVAKYPGKSYLWRQLIGEDGAIMALAFGIGRWHEPSFWLAALLTVFGVHVIYELGYRENDTLAVQREAKPTLAQPDACAAPPRHLAWCWAWIAWSLAAWLWTSPALERGLQPWLTVWATTREHRAALVVAALVVAAAATRLTFNFFNRAPVIHRVYFFAALQLGKSAAYGVILQSDAVGAALVLAQIFRQWSNYLIYRYRGDNRAFRRQVHRAMVFVLVLFAFELAAEPPARSTTVEWSHALVVCIWLAWCVAREEQRFRLFNVATRHRAHLEGHDPTPPLESR